MGYTRVDNELIDRLIRLNLPGQAWKVLFYLVRHTWGFNKLVVDKSYAQLVDNLGIEIRYLRRIIRQLSDDKIIKKEYNKKTHLTTFQVVDNPVDNLGVRVILALGGEGNFSPGGEGNFSPVPYCSTLVVKKNIKDTPPFPPKRGDDTDFYKFQGRGSVPLDPLTAQTLWSDLYFKKFSCHYIFSRQDKKQRLPEISKLFENEKDFVRIVKNFLALWPDNDDIIRQHGFTLISFMLRINKLFQR